MQVLFALFSNFNIGLKVREALTNRKPQKNPNIQTKGHVLFVLFSNFIIGLKSVGSSYKSKSTKES
jgi:hypothetical protein